jgi:hypothetical protein
MQQVFSIKWIIRPNGPDELSILIFKGIGKLNTYHKKRAAGLIGLISPPAAVANTQPDHHITKSIAWTLWLKFN